MLVWASMAGKDIMVTMIIMITSGIMPNVMVTAPPIINAAADPIVPGAGA
jgi:hypothetical protein